MAFPRSRLSTQSSSQFVLGYSATQLALIYLVAKSVEMDPSTRLPVLEQATCAVP